MVPVTVPQLGNEITEAEITEWLKPEGAQVRAGEPILSITTTKMSIEIEAPVDGVLSRRTAEGDVVEVGALLAEIG